MEEVGGRLFCNSWSEECKISFFPPPPKEKDTLPEKLSPEGKKGFLPPPLRMLADAPSGPSCQGKHSPPPNEIDFKRLLSRISLSRRSVSKEPSPPPLPEGEELALFLRVLLVGRREIPSSSSKRTVTPVLRKFHLQFPATQMKKNLFSLSFSEEPEVRLSRPLQKVGLFFAKRSSSRVLPPSESRPPRP